MASPAETQQTGLPFELYDYPSDWGVVGEVSTLIEAGHLPPDALFRLTSVGQRTSDDPEHPHHFLNWVMMLDMVDHARQPDKMQPYTRDVLYGKLPDAVVDVNSRVNHPAYAMMEPMYYRMADLVRTVRQRREANGQALPDKPYDRRLHTVQDELSRCKAIARPIWRLIVQRTHPEWLENPGDYFPSSYIGTFCVVYDISEPRQRRGIVTHAILSDPLVHAVYQEAETTGVKGIGPVGREDLRLLLLDEHPELAKGHEQPE